MTNADAPPSPARGKSPLAVLFLVVVIDLIGFGLVLPLLPRYATDFHASGLETGLLQAYVAYSLLQQPPRRVGFASGCQAFGHRELLGQLQAFGLVSEPVITRQRG